MAAPTGPDWDQLFETASSQDGHFTTAQAAAAGYSPQLLAKYLASGRVVRVRRAVYRLVHFPAGDHEDLTVTWLWSRQAGVFSHETALALHDLSDALPAKIHMTLPMGEEHSRREVPRGLVLHFADLKDRDRTWFGAVPVTTPTRTLVDCIDADVAPALVRQATEEGIARGLLTRRDAEVVRERLAEVTS